MTLRLRPSLSSSTIKPRPASAIFLGTTASNTSNLPELPEPPSPGGSSSSARSRRSGLPSPPATNSTGSGSTGGDNNSATAGSVRSSRDRAASLPPPPLHSDTQLKTMSTTSNSPQRKVNSTGNTLASLPDDDAPQTAIEDNDNDDLTLRIQSGTSSRSTKTENSLALRRAESLAQRNRVTLQKLSTFPRISSPSPSPSHASSSTSRASLSRARSPLLSPTASSSRLTIQHHTSPRKTPDTLSGSETEREQHAYSSDERDDPATPPPPPSHTHHLQSPPSALSPSRLSHRGSSTHASPAHEAASSSRQRRISAPPSPSKAVLALSREGHASDRKQDASAERPPLRSKKTINTAVVDHLFDRDHRQRDKDRERLWDGDVTASALAAVASFRESSGASTTGSLGRKSRTALPREFRESTERRSLDSRPPSSTPSTPHRQRLRLQHDDMDQNVYIARGSPSPRSSGSLMLAGGAEGTADGWSPRRTLRQRSGTIRGRSEDLDAGEGALALEDRAAERRAVGKAPDSPRSLFGQGLKAAGIMKRRESIDVVGGAGVQAAGTMKRRESIDVAGGAGVGRADGVDEDGAQEDVFAAAADGGRRRARLRSFVTGMLGPSRGKAAAKAAKDAPWESASAASSSSSRASRVTFSQQSRPDRRAVYDGDGEREGDEEQEDMPLRSAPPALSRGFKSPYPQEHVEGGRHHGAGSRQGMYHHMSPLLTGSSALAGGGGGGGSGGRHGSGVGTPLYRQPSPSPYASPTPVHHGGQQQHQHHQFGGSEHGRLMLESLKTFESQLLRLPPHRNTTAAVPELFKSAQSVVYTADRLNALLRAGTNRALEAQIDADLADADDPGGGAGRQADAEVWRRVGGEFRESLRVSDELVRTVTGCLLGMGKVLKDVSAVASAASAAGGETMEDARARSASLDLDDRGSGSVVSSSDAGGSVRRSLDERRSAEGGRRSVAGSHRSSEHGSDSLRRLVRPSSSLAVTAAAAVAAARRDREWERRRGSADENAHGVSLRSPSPPPSAALSPASSTRNLTDPLSLRRLWKRESQQQQLRVSLAESADSTETVLADRHQQLEDQRSPTTLASTPTPTSRVSAERTRALAKLASPPAQHAHLPSDSISGVRSHQGSAVAVDKGARRRSGVVGGSRSGMGPPPTPTVATPVSATSSLARTDSSSNVSAGGGHNHRVRSVMFSRSSSVSGGASSFGGLQQQDNRKRTISSTSSAAADPPVSVQKSYSGSDVDGEAMRRRTATGRTRSSLDSERQHHQQHQHQHHTQGASTARRERRPTVTEIFS